MQDSTAAETTRATSTEAVLTGIELSKRYGDLQVLSRVNFSVGPNEAVGIVGPNGAGKTTLLNVLAGSVAISAGRVRFEGNDITRLGPEIRCRRGIGRAFQIPRPFERMTVLENVIVGAAHGAQLSGRELHRRCVELLELCGLIDLANRPRVLLLDEIGAGLTDAEAAELVRTIKQLRQLRISIVWIEHIVHVLVQVIDRPVCMDAGRVIATASRRKFCATPL
jgi:branched-chain amino acid transport system ATP-binding protein